MDSDSSIHAMVTRAKKRVKLDTPSAASQGAVSKSVPSAPAKPKQQRTRKQGRLATLLSMPMDVLFEIFGHLRPYDLLKLSRLTKEFRQALMSRRSIGVWRAARDNVPGLPDCPADMTEPEYANLAFDPRCHNCGAVGVRNADWLLRTRLCTKCSKELIREDISFYETSDDLLPHRDFEGLTSPIYLAIIPHRPSKRPWRLLYLQDHLDEVEMAYTALSNDEERKVFVRQRKQKLAQREAHAKKCEEWAKTQSKDRTAELQQLKDDRRRAIVQRLIALGWEEDIRSIRWPDSLEDHRLVKQPHKLTDRIWLNIQSEIISFMQEMRAKRLRRERKSLVMKRKQIAMDILRAYKNGRLPETDVMPEPPDFCNFDEIREIINRPSEVDVTEEMFEELTPQFADIFDAWRYSLRQQLAKIIVDEQDAIHTHGLSDDEEEVELRLMDLDKALERLPLAMTVFTCYSCGDYKDPWSDDFYWGLYDDGDAGDDEPLIYPKVLGHSCLRRTYGWDWDIITQDNTNVADPSTRLECQPRCRKEWSASCLRYDVYMSKLAQNIVRVAGLDPETATAVEMDALDIRFICMSRACTGSTHSIRSGPPKAKLHTWREAIKHSQFHMGDFTPAPVTWKTIKTSSIEKRRAKNSSPPPPRLRRLRHSALSGSPSSGPTQNTSADANSAGPSGSSTLSQPASSTDAAGSSSGQPGTSTALPSVKDASSTNAANGDLVSETAKQENDEVGQDLAEPAASTEQEASSSPVAPAADIGPEPSASTSTVDADVTMAGGAITTEADEDALPAAASGPSNHLASLFPPTFLATAMMSALSAAMAGEDSDDLGSDEPSCYYGVFHDKIWSCTKCRDSTHEIDNVSVGAIKRHCKSRHDIENPTVNVDYFRDFAVPEYPFIPTASDHIHYNLVKKKSSKGKQKKEPPPDSSRDNSRKVEL